MESSSFQVKIEVTKEISTDSESIKKAIVEQESLLRKGFFTIDGVDYKIVRSTITEKRSNLIMMIVELDASNLKTED